MIVRIDKGFQKDVGKINDVKIKSVIADTIESIRTTDTISAIKNLKKLTGYKEFYRIRIGDYRIGLR